MLSNLVTVVLANTIGLVFILLLAPHAEKLGLLDRPTESKTHVEPAALIGGLSIYCAILTCLLLIDRPAKLNYLLAGITILVVLGVADDILSLSVKLRISAHFFTIFLMIFGGEVWIAELQVSDSQIISVGIWGYLITGIVGVYVMNAFNMSDGIDGLAVVYALSCLILIVVSQMTYSEFRQLPWIASLAIALIIFGIFNIGMVPRYKIFLGDAGSIPIGYILFWLLIDFSQGGDSPSMHPIAAIWCLVIPIFDATNVCIRRALEGTSPTGGDKNHIHYTLLAAGLKPPQILVALGAANFLLGCSGIFISHSYGPLTGVIAYVLTFLLYVFYDRKLQTDNSHQ